MTILPTIAFSVFFNSGDAIKLTVPFAFSKQENYTINLESFVDVGIKRRIAASGRDMDIVLDITMTAIPVGFVFVLCVLAAALSCLS